MPCTLILLLAKVCIITCCAFLQCLVHLYWPKLGMKGVTAGLTNVTTEFLVVPRHVTDIYYDCYTEQQQVNAVSTYSLTAA